MGNIPIILIRLSKFIFVFSSGKRNVLEKAYNILIEEIQAVMINTISGVNDYAILPRKAFHFSLQDNHLPLSEPLFGILFRTRPTYAEERIYTLPLDNQIEIFQSHIHRRKLL